jgi:hypothetical protein
VSFLDGKLYRLAYYKHQVYGGFLTAGAKAAFGMMGLPVIGDPGTETKRDHEEFLKLILKSLRNKYKELDRGMKVGPDSGFCDRSISGEVPWTLRGPVSNLVSASRNR